MAEATQLPGLGANKYDLLLQFTGRASGGDGSPASRAIDRAMARKAISDGRAEGFSFFRVAAAGYGPSWPDDLLHNDLALWLAQPAAYWADVDDMFAELDADHMRLVPSLLWNIQQFPALTGETVSDLVKNRRSRSRALAMRYITDFVSRYKARSTILFYEMGNEFNLLADLDSVGHCRIKFGIRQFCDSTGNFSTADLLAFSRDIVGLFKRLDPGRGVSSGYSMPPAWASHLERRPQFGTEGADWTPDSRSEFESIMVRTNAPFDIVSLHIYPGGDNKRAAFGANNEADMAGVASALFHKSGKKVFVGEVGDRGGSHVIGDVLSELREGHADYAAVWVWEAYRSSGVKPGHSVENEYLIEPGHGDAAVRAALVTSNSRK